MASGQPGSRCRTRGTAGGRGVTERLGNSRQYQELGIHWPAQKPTSAPRGIWEGASWWGCSRMGSFQRLSREYWTEASREAAVWTDTPGAPMLVSQQSKPQSLSARFAASTSGRARSAGRKGSRSLPPSAPSENVQPRLQHRQGTGVPVVTPSLASSTGRLWTRVMWNLAVGPPLSEPHLLIWGWG